MSYRRRTVRLATVLLPGIALCTACSVGATDGSEIASSRAEATADEIAEKWADPLGDAEQIVHAWFLAEAVDGVTIEPLRWSGSGNHGIEIEARIHVRVEAREAGSVFGERSDAGESTRCFRFTWEGHNRTGRHDDIDCPRGPAPARPAPMRPPKLPEEVEERVAAVLSTHDAAAKVEAALRQEFPSSDITIYAAHHEGGVVVAVGMPSVRDCHVSYREADGSISLPVYDRIWLQPGELGCTVELVTSPPL